MEQILLFHAMRSCEKPTFRRVKIIFAALLLSVFGVGGVQAQCTFNASDFTVEPQDGSDDMPYDDMVTLNYNGSEPLDSIHFIITETSTGLSDSTNVTYDVDESRWYVQFSYLTAGDYTISLRPYCNGQASGLLSNGNTWSFTIECTPENATPVIDDIDYDPVCSGTTTVTLSTSSTCGSADNYEYYLDDPDWNGDPDNYDGTYENVTPGEHTFTVVNVNNSHFASETITITEQTVCETVLAGSSELSISGFTYEDYDNTGNFGQFYYTIQVPTFDGDYLAVEAQYCLAGTKRWDEDWSATYLNTATSNTTLNIPISSKGDWVVRLRTRCCGDAFPGGAASEWLLTDTIHHYLNRNTWILQDVCTYGDGQANLSVTEPYGISNGTQSNGAELWWRITNTNTSQVVYEGSNLNLDDNTLYEGTHVVHFFLADNEGEEFCDAYFDTTFTIGRKVSVAIIGDNATACSTNPSVTMSASASGGTEPYSYSWSNGTNSSTCVFTEAYGLLYVIATDNTGCIHQDTATINWVDYTESEDIEEASVCEGATTYTWKGNTITLDNEHMDNGVYVYLDTVTVDNSCPSVTELHLTVKPNAIAEEDVVAWGTSYTWPINGTSYNTNMGGYNSMEGDCPVFVEYSTAAPSAIHSGVAANGCDSVYSLNLTLIDGIPVPATGTTDTTLASIVEGDTVWVYDEKGMMGGYTLNQTGILVLNAPAGYTLQVEAKEFAVGDGGKVNIFYSVDDVQDSSPDFFENDGSHNSTPYVSSSRKLVFQFSTGDAIGTGFKLAVTPKAIDCSDGLYNDSILEVDTILCANNSMSWHSQTVSFEADDLATRARDGYYVWEYTATGVNANGCDSVYELHIAMKPNSVAEESIIAFQPYTWRTGNTYFDSFGYYNIPAEGCVNPSYYTNDAIEYLVSGVATNGCDSLYILNLTYAEGIPVPASGTTDTTLSTMAEGDTVMIYDIGALTYSYPLDTMGVLTLRAPEGYTLQVTVDTLGLTDDDNEQIVIYSTPTVGSEEDVLEYFTAGGDYETVTSPSGVMTIQFISGSTQGQGFRLAVNLKSLDDTCLAVYNLDYSSDDLDSLTLTWQHKGDALGYHVKLKWRSRSVDDWEIAYDTTVTDTTVTFGGLLGHNELFAMVSTLCANGDTAEVQEMPVTICGLRPFLVGNDGFWIETDPLGWRLNYDEGMPTCWSRIGYTVPGTDSIYPVHKPMYGGYSAIYFLTNAETDQYAIMPKFDTLYGGMNTWALKFALELGDSLHNTVCDLEPVVMYVGVMTEPSDANTFTVVDSVVVNSNDYPDGAPNWDNEYYVSLANYSGSGLYPAFRMAKREQHNPNDYLNATMTLSYISVVPDGGLRPPTNVTVADHPTLEGKGIISWTEPALPDYDDDFTPSYEIVFTDSYGNSSTQTADYGATSYTFDVNGGTQYKIKLYYKVTQSPRLAWSWKITDGITYNYEKQLYDNQTVDTISDLSFTGNISNRMPFSYGEPLSTEILVKADEIDATAINAIAFRQAPSCLTGSSTQTVELFIKDVTLTELDPDNMTDDYAFTSDDIKFSNTISVGSDSWLTIQFNSSFTHDPDKNILIGIASWDGNNASNYSGFAKFYCEDNNDSNNDNLALEFPGESDLYATHSGSLAYRPQMKFISSKNCTNDTVFTDTNLCELASLDWRGQTISFSDDDIEIHKVAIDSTYDNGWEYTYAYIFNDKVEGVGTDGCDSVYQLRITKRYNETNNYDSDTANGSFVNNCGPYTWRNGLTYYESCGSYIFVEDGQSPVLMNHSNPRVMDTLRGVTIYGCDSIYGLNLTIDPYYTVVFDTTGVDLGTGMEPVYRCDGSDYTLPACTMTVAYKAFTGWYWADGDTTFDSYSIGSHVIPYSDIDGDTILLTPIFECVDSTDYTSYEGLCPVGGEYEWHGHTVTMQYAMQHGMLSNIDMINFYEIYDTVHGAVGGVCDSVYHLRLRMENKLEMEYVSVCPLGYTWIDGNHYDSDTAVTYIDSTANNGCGVMHFLSIQADDPDSTYATDTIYFIRYYVENATELDTLHSMTMYVCDGYKYVVPELPDTATREGYDFVTWSDNPACGWTVDPGDNETADASVIYLYGMWESNCSNDTIYDTTTVCVNDTVVWHGFTWRGAELEFGTWDTTMTKYGVIPGECDSVFMLTITVPGIPILSVTGREDPLCYGDQNGWISMAVDDGNAPFQYALGDSSYTAALDTTGYKFENLSSGSHTVWVKDACGVTDMAQVEISTPNLLTVNVSSYTDSAVCYEAGKQLNAEISGGTGIYTYIWNNDTNRTNDTLMVNTSIAGTRTDTVVVTDENGCTSVGSYTTLVYDTMTVTVNGGDTTYCFGATAVPVTVTVTGGDTNSGYIYTWYDYNQQTVQDESITVPTNAAASYSQMGVTVSNSCGTKQLTVPTITVLDSFYVGPVSEISRGYCFNSTAGQIEIPVTGGGAFTGQWYMNGEPVTDHNPADADNKYTPRTDTSGTFNYSLKITSNAGCGSDSVTVGTITVYEPFAINVFAHDTNYCYGVQADTIAISLTGFDEEGNSLISWYAITGTDTTSVNNDTPYNSTYVPPTTSAGTTSYIVIVDAGCGVDTAEVATITVYDSLLVMATSADATYCLNAAATALTVTVAGGDGLNTYQWYTNSEEITGATAGTYTPSTAVAGDYVYSVQVGSICGTDSINVATITVNGDLYASAVSDKENYCQNEMHTLTVTPDGGSGNYTYQWYDATGTAIDGATSQVFIDTTNTAGNHTFNVKVMDDWCGSTDSISVTFNVYDVFEASDIPIDTICKGSTNTLTTTVTGGSGVYSYQWQQYDSSADAWNNIVGATDASYTTEMLTTQTQYRVTITDDSCGTSTTKETTVHIHDSVSAISNNDDSATYCFNSTATALAVTVNSGSGNYTYQWYMDGNAIDGANTAAYTPSTDTAGEFNYMVIINDECLSSDTVSVQTTIIYPETKATTTSDSAYSFCYGSDDAVELSVSVTQGTLSYPNFQWYISGDPPGNGGLDTYTVETSLAGVSEYTVWVSNGCGTDSILVSTVTVYDPMTVTSASDSITYYCPGVVADPLRVNVSGGSGQYRYTWSNPNGDILGTDSIYTPATSGDYDTVITVLVTDTICESEQEITVTRIRLYDMMTASLSTEYFGAVCIHSEVDTIFVQTEGGSGSYTYQWLIKRDPGSDIIDTIEGATESFYHPTTDTASIGDNFYVMVSDINGCGDTTIGSVYMYVTDSVKIRTSYFESIDSTYCLGDTASTIQLYFDGGAGGSYTYWYVNGVATSDTALFDSLSYTPSTEVPGSYDISAKISMTVCGSDSVHVKTIKVGDFYTAFFITGNDSLQSVNTMMDSIVECTFNPLQLPANEYVYEEHTFRGWYNQSTGDTLQPGETVYLTENTTFNTLWRDNCYNIDSIDYVEFCFGNTFSWRGQNIDGSDGEYTDTIPGVVDELCDSVYHLNVTVNYPTTSDTTILACDSVWWNGMFFTETPDTTQSYLMAGGNQYGCDSTAYLNLTVNYSIHDYVVETACDSYVFDSVTYTESADLPTIGDISDNGCPFITHISLTVNYSYHGEDSATACDMYVWNDMELTESGDHDFESFTVDGCDSVITLHLTMHNSTMGVDSLTACDSLSWIDGNTYFSDFTFDDQISYLLEGANQYGCDSTAVLYLTMQDHIYVEFLSDFGDGWMDEIAACMMKPLVVPECAYVNEGFVFNGWTNQMDSMMVMPGDTLYLENSVSYYASWVPLCEDVLVFTDTVLCEGSSFTWRGQDFTNQLFSGDYEDVAYAAIENYCDSIYYLRLTVYPISLNEFFDSVAGLYYWYDDEYTTSGVYERHTGVNRYGCDSTEVLHLVVYLGIDDKEEAIEVKVYPNPTSGLVNLDGVEIKKVSVVDMVGRTVATFTEQSQIDIRDLPAGNYTLFIETANGNTTRRIIKR